MKTDISFVAEEFKGNWQRFPSFYWNRQQYINNPENWMIFYTHNRDSGNLKLSNAAMIDEILDGCPEDEIFFEHHNHWACGWIEGYAIKVINDNGDYTDTFKLFYDQIYLPLQDYPLLDDCHYSELCFDDYIDSWHNYGHYDFIKALENKFGLNYTTVEFLEELELLDFYENLIPSGEFYIDESSGVSLNIDYAVKNCNRNTLAQFIINNR